MPRGCGRRCGRAPSSVLAVSNANIGLTRPERGGMAPSTARNSRRSAQSRRPSHHQRLPAVDPDRRAGDVARPLGGEEQHKLRHLLARAGLALRQRDSECGARERRRPERWPRQHSTARPPRPGRDGRRSARRPGPAPQASRPSIAGAWNGCPPDNRAVNAPVARLRQSQKLHADPHSLPSAGRSSQ